MIYIMVKLLQISMHASFLCSLLILFFSILLLLIKHLCSNSDESDRAPGFQHYGHFCEVETISHFLQRAKWISETS